MFRFHYFKWKAGHNRRREKLLSKMSMLNVKNSNLMFFGVSAIGSDCFTMDGI
jgi:hypothetical protein